MRSKRVQNKMNQFKCAIETLWKSLNKMYENYIGIVTLESKMDKFIVNENQKMNRDSPMVINEHDEFIDDVKILK